MHFFAEMSLTSITIRTFTKSFSSSGTSLCKWQESKFLKRKLALSISFFFRLNHNYHFFFFISIQFVDLLPSTSTLFGKSTAARPRIPITSKPQLKPDPISRDLAVVHEKDIQSRITSKFLSSSIASTNIMDTSDLPVTIETTTTTTSGMYIKKVTQILTWKKKK